MRDDEPFAVAGLDPSDRAGDGVEEARPEGEPAADVRGEEIGQHARPWQPSLQEPLEGGLAGRTEPLLAVAARLERGLEVLAAQEEVYGIVG